LYVRINVLISAVSNTCTATVNCRETATVRLLSQCNQIFGDIFVTFRSNSPLLFEEFRQTLKQNFNLIQQQISPLDPKCKNRTLSTTSWHCRKQAIFINGGILRNSLPVVGFEWKLQESLFKTFKLWRWDWARCYTNFAENLFALGWTVERVPVYEPTTKPYGVTH